MGQKVNPRSFRIGQGYTWDSIWYTGNKREYVENLAEDIFLRNFIEGYFSNGDIDSVVIERFGEKIKINIHTGRPGVVIGRGGEEIEKIKKLLSSKIKKEFQIDIYEIADPNLNASLIAKSVARSIEKRIQHRRAMKRAVSNAMASGALGVKISAAGRLQDAEIARTEWYREGRVPLHTIKANIDYGIAEATTKFGKIGIKVWVYRKREEE
ncbi:MAG: 30S ribosomal protein S3 [bacterium]